MLFAAYNRIHESTVNSERQQRLHPQPDQKDMKADEIIRVFISLDKIARLHGKSGASGTLLLSARLRA